MTVRSRGGKSYFHFWIFGVQGYDLCPFKTDEYLYGFLSHPRKVECSVIESL